MLHKLPTSLPSLGEQPLLMNGGRIAILAGQEAYADAYLNRARQAYALQGGKAFDCPRSAAALHEAGHAVLYAHEGLPVRSVKIWHESHDGRRIWLGETNTSGDGWVSGPHTCPQGDLKNARCLMAGVAAEALFEPENFRHGSSMDELAFAEGLCANVSYKLKHPMQEVYGETFAAVLRILKQHDRVVRGIAEALNRHGSLKGKRLAKLLAFDRRD